MAVAKPSRDLSSVVLQSPGNAETEGLVIRNPLVVAQEIRQGLIWKREGYARQMGWIGRIIGLLDEAIKDQDSQIKWLKG